MKIANSLAFISILATLMIMPSVVVAQAGVSDAATAVGAAAASNAATITQGAALNKAAEQTVSNANGTTATSILPSANTDAVTPSLPVLSAVPPVVSPSTTALDANAGTMHTIGLGAVPGIASEEDKKTPDAVKNVMKRLNNTTSNITLEDLNAAREAVARVDMLIELEKKLKDLSEVRKGRKGADPFEDALPASALASRLPTPQPISPPTFTEPIASLPPIMPATSSVGNIVVERIMGAGGRYAAMIKVNDAKAILTRPGDELSDGSTIKAISDQGVTIENNKKTKTINVRNVNNVFSSR